MNNQTEIARKLINNLTEAEKKLWYYLRGKNLGVKFRRQHPIGNYFVDFICLEKKLAIELDDGQHYQSSSDAVRDGFIKTQGFAILRFWNNEVFENINGVLEKIKENL